MMIGTAAFGLDLTDRKKEDVKGKKRKGEMSKKTFHISKIMIYDSLYY